MKRLPWIAAACLMIGVYSSQAVLSAVSDDVDIPDIAGVDIRPTQEQFEAEVEAIRKQSEAFDEVAEKASAAYEEAREAHREAIDGLRANRGEQNDARKTYREAWDRVRQLLMDNAGEAALGPALKEARDATEQLEADGQQPEPDAQDSKARYEAASQAMRRASEAYQIARDSAYDYSSLLRSAERTLRLLDREGAYADYVEEKRRVETELDARERYAERLKTWHVERELEAEQWEARWAEMTPAEQVVEVEKLEAKLDSLKQKSETIDEQHQAMLMITRELHDKQNKLVRETGSLRTKRSELNSRIRESVRADGGDPETQARLEQAKAELEAVLAELADKEALVTQVQHEREQKSMERIEIYRDLKIAREEVSVVLTRHRNARREVANNPDASKIDPAQREINAIREAWEQVAGKDVEWGTNPFKGTPISTSGSITQDGPDMKVTLDRIGYHAQMHITNKDRSLHVFDDSAEVLYSGPTNDITHLKDFSQELYYLWEFLYTQVKFN